MALNSIPFHGKTCRIEKDGTELEYNVDWNIDVTIDIGDGKRMGQQWKEGYPGLTQWDGSFKGSFAPGNTEQKAFFDNIVAAIPGIELTDVEFNLDNATNYFEGDLFINKLHIDVAVNNTVTYDIGFHGDGLLTLSSCDTVTNVNYDSDNPATIARNDSDVEITVSDGIGPFTWSVAGTGFSLGSATTTGRTNTLDADGTACGTAIITITDACDDTATGYVRCTTGQWVQKSTGSCIISGAITDTISEPDENSGEHERISGYQKQYQLWGSKCGVASGFYDCENPYPGCGDGGASECNEGTCLATGCTPCLTGGNIPSMGCRNYTGGGSYQVDCVKGLTYYEWEC